MESPSTPRIKDKVIGPRKPKGVSKSPRESRIRKMAKDAQEKQMGQGCLIGKWDTRARKQCKNRANDHTESLGEG